jgi:hypothetical protein
VKSIAALIGLTVSGAASTVMAAPVTYYVQSQPYGSQVANYETCTVGQCAQYLSSQKVSGTITFLAPLASNLADDDVDMQINSFTISDGPNTYTDAQWSSDVFVQSARVSTDSDGNLTAFEFKFDKTFGTPYATSSYSDPKARVSYIWFSSANDMAIGATNSTCHTRGDNVSGNTSGAGCMGSWDDQDQGTSSAISEGVTMSLTPPPPPAAIPTLSKWAMILMAMALAGMAGVGLRSRQVRHP